jgi:hypothetical protein
VTAWHSSSGATGRAAGGDDRAFGPWERDRVRGRGAGVAATAAPPGAVWDRGRPVPREVPRNGWVGRSGSGAGAPRCSASHPQWPGLIHRSRARSDCRWPARVGSGALGNIQGRTAGAVQWFWCGHIGVINCLLFVPTVALRWCRPLRDLVILRCVSPGLTLPWEK